MNLNRRAFVKIVSLASTTLIPAVRTLANILGIKEESNIGLNDLSNSELEFHLIDNNLLNLHFYFINAKQKGTTIVPASEDLKLKSFMIVRLPQMHISEKGYWGDDWNNAAKRLPGAVLSGYSYLAFQLWPDKLSANKKIEIPHYNKKLEFTLQNVLNWNDESNFELITLVEWFDLKKQDSFAFADFKKCDEFNTRKVWHLSNEETSLEEATKPYFVKESNEPSNSFNYKKYRSLVRHFLDQNLSPSPSVKNFIPITMLEFPQGVVLVPIARDSTGALAQNDKKPIKQFWSNNFVNQEKTAFGYRKYEVWNNTLFYKSKVKTKGEDTEPTFKIETPSFRIAGLITDKDVVCPDLRVKECEEANTNNRTLPTLLDKTELAFLTQFAKGEGTDYGKIDFTDKKFDIKESNGLFFTGLGIITHLKYYNEDTPPGIDIIEYEHIITEGRDIFIKVARVGIHNKNGKRYKHVIEGNRKIESEIIDPVTGKVTYTFPEGATSFIELKQYCECIEKIKNYEIPENPTIEEWNVANFIRPLRNNPNLHPIFYSATSNNTHYRRFPWKEIKTIEKKRIPIEPFQDQTDGKPISKPECALWFWPVLEETLSNPKYLHSVFDAHDWDNGKLNLATPFIFIRKSLIESGDTTEINNLTNSYFKHISEDLTDPINLRRKIAVNNQKIAFTKPLPTKNTSSLRGQELSNALNESKSKTHILETDFIETYFDFSKPSVFTTDKPFAKVRFPLFPQLLRAKVFVDHVRDLTQQKIPSIIEYHENYIDHEFKEFVLDPVDATKRQYANAAKQILANTEAFINEKEELVNNKHVEIKNALQEAKDKLGNLAFPDIIPDTISLDKFGVTLPKRINDSIANGKTVLSDASAGLQKIASFNPRELLRGKLSDVCGLDLTAILDELIPADSFDNQTPLFEINKALGTIENEILESPIYKDIIEGKKKLQIADPLDNGKLKYPQELIEDYKTIILELRTSVENQRLELNKKLKELINEIPNAEELNNLVKNVFEQYRSEAFNLIKKQDLFIDINTLLTTVQANGKTLIEEAKEFYELEINTIEEELDAKKSDAVNIIKSVVDELAIQEISVELSKPQFIALKNKINEIITSETKNIFGSLIKQYEDYLVRRKPGKVDFINFLNDRYSKMLLTTKEISFPQILSEDVYINNETYELVKKNQSKSSVHIQLTLLNDINSTGVVQLGKKVEEFKTLIVKNINGNFFQKKVVEELQKTYFKPYETAYENSQTQLRSYSEQFLGDISKNVRFWEQEFDAVYNDAIAKGLIPIAQDSIAKIKALIHRLIPYVDDLRKIDPYYYYKEQERLRIDIEDIERRFTKLVFSEYTKVKHEIKSAVANYKRAQVDFSKELEKFQQNPIDNLKEYTNAKSKLTEIRRNQVDLINNFSNRIIEKLKNTDEYKKANKIRIEIESQITKFKQTKDKLEQYIQYQKSILQQQATEYSKQLDQKVKDYIDEQENKLVDAIVANNILEIQNNIKEAQNIYRLLTSIKQQDLTYSWNTDKFRDINLGIVSFKKFSNPNTALKVDVRATTYFTSGKFPPVIEKVDTYSENRFTNFGISFFNSLTIGFNEISFITGSERPTYFNVNIKDVKFDGALSFVQAFESWLKTMGKGLITRIHTDHIELSYSLPIPSIKTPAFSFFNLSLNFDLRVYFDKRPLHFGFSLARPESKFGIAAGIFAGFGYFSIAANPKQGIVEISCGLEAGVWTGIQLGPISGEAKLAFGFSYTKNEFGVILEGYIVAEGRLKVWILEVSARIYLGVISKNSYVEGVCTVTYSVKLGFISKSFSGTFYKKISGAHNNNAGELANKYVSFFKDFGNKLNKDREVYLHTQLVKKLENFHYNEFETHAVSFDDWKQFIILF